ncbi:hypothetical protein L0Y40_02890 [Candidatus Wolfebacteria bacterium]|nr:hypothetical protein [Candidatus Wolfebacteria bacterium]
MTKKKFSFFLGTLVLVFGSFGFVHTAEAGGSYFPPLFPTPSFSLDGGQNNLTVTAAGGSGFYQFFQATCPNGPGGPYITGPYLMDDGLMGIGSVSAVVNESEITETDPGEVGAVCDSPGSRGAFSTTKVLDVSGLPNNTYALSVTMCTTPQICATRTADVTINRASPPPPPPPPALVGSCVGSPNPAAVNQAVTWAASASGGTGSYTYSWSGTDGLSGTSQSVNKVYSAEGTKSATVTITSGSQSINRSCSITVNPNPAPPEYILTVTKNGTGTGTVTGPGISCGSDCDDNYAEGTQVPLTATADPGSVFVGWSGACSGTGGCTVTMNANKSVTATFNAVPPNNPVSCSPSSQSVPINSSATLTASGGNGLYSWAATNGALPSTGTGATFSTSKFNPGSSSITVTSDGQSAICSASWTSAIYQLFVQKQGTGSGKVVSYPVGIDCGLDCSGSYYQNTNVSLTATADPGSMFAGWGGACSGTDTYTATLMTGNKTCTATFNTNPLPQHQLTVSVNGSGSGTVTSNPTGINCTATGGDCSEYYDQGATVYLTPSEGAGSTFVGWSGDTDCSDGQVLMSSARNCTATFNATAPTTGSVNVQSNVPTTWVLTGPKGQQMQGTPVSNMTYENQAPGSYSLVNLAEVADYEYPPTIAPASSQTLMAGDSITFFVTYTLEGMPGPGLSCDGPDSAVSTYETMTFTATGGTGTYNWSSPSGCNQTGGSGATYEASCSTVGTKNFTVSDDNGDATCVVELIAQCSDDKDNDKDALIDWDGNSGATVPDPGCIGPDDTSEVNTVPQCSDSVDNDGDKIIDFSGGDPGCVNEDDDDETDPIVTQCSDGLDNDGDGLTDFAGGDTGCISPSDDNEQNPQFEEF